MMLLHVLFNIVNQINKMIKYIGEREVDLVSPRIEKKTHSLEKVTRSQSFTKESPEDYHTSS